MGRINVIMNISPNRFLKEGGDLMALGTLSIFYIVLAIIGVVVQILLYKDKNERKNGVFIINTLLGIILSYMAYTSFATNFTGQRILALSLGILSVLALILKLATQKNTVLSKTMLSISIVGSFLLLFL